VNERACVGVLILCTGEDYGKWRGRIQVECCFNDERQKHLQSKTNLKCTTPYHNRDNTFAIVELSKKMVKLDPWNAVNYLQLGKDYKLQGNLIKSKEMLDKILSFSTGVVGGPIAEQAKKELSQ
jgi:hypothetical protein